MAKYFEAVNNDGSICVDDTYQNLELLEVVELKNAKKTLISDTPYGKNWQYTYTCSDIALKNGLLRGVGLSELAGKSFCMSIVGNNIYFYDPKAGNKNGAERDDVMEKARLYIFGYNNRQPAQHLAGLEIYNADGGVVYSSDAQYLDVLACGNEETANVAFDKNDDVCILELGSDTFLHLYIVAHQGTKGIDSETHPYFEISDGAVTIKKVTFNDAYVDDIDMEHPLIQEEFKAWYTYGWLMGRVLK